MKRILLFAFAATLLCGASVWGQEGNPDDLNGDGFHDGDVAVIKALADKGLAGLTVPEDPDEWDFVTSWNGGRIARLNMKNRSLSGTLDVSGLDALISLECSYNQLTSLDVSDCTALTDLSCNYNQLTSLDVSSCTALIYLDCSSNQLTELDVSGLTALTTLNCSGRYDLDQLKSLNISGCTALTTLKFQYNQLTSIVTKDGYRFSLSVYPAAGGSVMISSYDLNSSVINLEATANESYVFKGWKATPEVEFNYPSAEYAEFTMPDEDVTITAEFEEMLPYNQGDIEIFNNIITKNWTGDYQRPSFDDPEGWKKSGIVTWNANGRISRLNFYDGMNGYILSGALDVSGLTALTTLDCRDYANRGCKLTSLNVSGLTALTTLNCSGCQLTSFVTKEGYTISLLVSPTESGSAIIVVDDLNSPTMRLYATANEGYLFKGWKATPTVELELVDQPYHARFTMPDTDVTFTAEFEEAELSVSPAALNFAAEGEDKVLTIESNTNWYAWSDALWLSIYYGDNYGDGTVIITAKANPSTTPRTATIIVGAEGVESKTVSVMQVAAEDTPPPTLTVSASSLNFSAAGEVKELTVASNTNWKVSSSSESWLTVSPASGSNNGTVTVTAKANTALTRRTGTISVGSVGVDTLTISVTQDAASPPAIAPEETQEVGASGNGVIALNLYLPTNATLTGSFEVRFPAGMTLDRERTVLSAALSGSFSLTFTARANNTWSIEIRDKASRASALSSEYRKIMDIAYKVSTDVKQGIYNVTVRDLEFLLSDDTWIEEDVLTVPVHVTQTITSVEGINDTPFTAYFAGDMLRVESSRAERISVYSFTGVLLYTVDKPEGMIEIPFPSNKGIFCIVRGSRSGVKKIVRGKL